MSCERSSGFVREVGPHLSDMLHKLEERLLGDGITQGPRLSPLAVTPEGAHLPRKSAPDELCQPHTRPVGRV